MSDQELDSEYSLWGRKSGLSKAQAFLDKFEKILQTPQYKKIKPLTIRLGLIKSDGNSGIIGNKIQKSSDNIDFIKVLEECIKSNDEFLKELYDVILHREGIDILILSGNVSNIDEIFPLLKVLGIVDNEYADNKYVFKAKLTGLGIVLFKSLFPGLFFSDNKKLLAYDEQIQLPYELSVKNKDLFLSYASENKDDIARPLVHELMEQGISVWFDGMHLIAGRSLRESLAQAIEHCLGGIAVFSPEYFGVSKAWTKEEIKWFKEESDKGNFIIKPVWHNVNKEWLCLHKKKDLSEIQAITSKEKAPKQIAEEIVNEIKRDKKTSLNN